MAETDNGLEVYYARLKPEGEPLDYFKKKKTGQSGLSGKLLAVDPEYRFSVYKKAVAKRKKPVRKNFLILAGSFENGKRR